MLAAKGMTAVLIKILGTAHGIFALWTVLILPGLFKSGVLSQLSPVQATIKLTATLLGIATLFLCMWLSWQLDAGSFIYAWIALGTFVLSAFSDTVALRGPAGLSRLMPTFYKAVAVRALAASLLTGLILSLPDPSVGG